MVARAQLGAGCTYGARAQCCSVEANALCQSCDTLKRENEQLRVALERQKAETGRAGQALAQLRQTCASPSMALTTCRPRRRVPTPHLSDADGIHARRPGARVPGAGHCDS